MVPLGTADGLALQMEALGTAIRTIRHFKLKHLAMQMEALGTADGWALQWGLLGAAVGIVGCCI